MSTSDNPRTRHIVIFDTTLRDGEQAPGCSMNVEEKIRVALTLEQMGVDIIEAGFAIASEGDYQCVREVAKRVNARWTTVVPGRHDVGLEWDYQTANVIDNLRRCVEVFEPVGLVMVLEPLNPWKDHPGLFLTKVPQAFQICRSVASPCCKILFDMYHQQITEGNIIPNIDRAWSEVAYLQIGDNPGRKEPTTGEMNYKNIFGHIHGKGYAGVLGMEHGLSIDGKAGEQALIDAYVSCDSF